MERLSIKFTLWFQHGSLHAAKEVEPQQEVSLFTEELKTMQGGGEDVTGTGVWTDGRSLDRGALVLRPNLFTCPGELHPATSRGRQTGRLF